MTKRNINLIFLPFFTILIFLNAGLYAQSPFIHVDQFGYFLRGQKIAVLTDPQQGFNAGASYTPGNVIQLIDNGNNQVVFSAAPMLYNDGQTDGLSGDRGWHFNFSEIDAVGEYYLYDPTNDIRSARFIISEAPYKDVLNAAFKAFYYNRCNHTKEAPYADENWTDGMNFDGPMQDFNVRFIYDRENANLEKDLSGGWFDAGDYNKYITFTYSVIHDLLAAYSQAPDLFGDDWNIPESGNGISDLIDEVIWEIDWMYKMANPDGSVHNKMGSQNHQDNSQSPPSANNDQRFYGPTCTSASATLASNFAHVSKVLNDIGGLNIQASLLLDQAIRSFDYALEAFNTGSLQTNCDDGSIVAGDADLNEADQKGAMVTAAIYLLGETGETKYAEFISSQVFNVEPLSNNFWGPYRMPIQDALLYYVQELDGDAALKELIMSSFSENVMNNWNGFFGAPDNSIYRDFMPDWSHHWGSNNIKASYGSLNFLAHQSFAIDANKEFIHKANGIIHSFHGVNPLNLVYLSNMYSFGAEKSVNEVYHLWFQDGSEYDHALNSAKGPAPGFVSGGPNKDFSIASISPPANQPPAKSYLDYNTGWPDNSWEISEPAIYYQASYVRLLSEVINNSVGLISAVENIPGELDKFAQISPNPADQSIRISGTFERARIQISTLTGQVVLTKNNYANGTLMDVSTIPNGIYVVSIISAQQSAFAPLKMIIHK